MLNVSSQSFSGLTDIQGNNHEKLSIAVWKKKKASEFKRTVCSDSRPARADAGQFQVQEEV